ncbi:MAG TPA: hypothetical protein PKL78_10470 [Anaerolineales bacterium]|nr:hypothetical protein [Anaerolineales bacterium]
MLTEAIDLESLRQRIEDAEYESGSMSDFIDLGRPDAPARRNAQETILKRDKEAKDLKEQLKKLIQVSPPTAVEEWVNFHTAILLRIIQEPVTDANIRTRQTVAKTTLKHWEEVSAGTRDYVGINWHFLKDYKAEVRRTRSSKNWWGIWK